MTEQEARDAIAAANQKIRMLRSEQDQLWRKDWDTRSEDPDKQRIRKRLSEIWNASTKHASGQLPEAKQELALAEATLVFVCAPKVIGIPALDGMVFIRGTKKYVILRSSPTKELRVCMETGEVKGDIRTRLDAVSLQSLQALSNTLEKRTQ